MLSKDELIQLAVSSRIEAILEGIKRRTGNQVTVAFDLDGELTVVQISELSPYYEIVLEMGEAGKTSMQVPNLQDGKAMTIFVSHWEAGVHRTA